MKEKIKKEKKKVIIHAQCTLTIEIHLTCYIDKCHVMNELHI